MVVCVSGDKRMATGDKLSNYLDFDNDMMTYGDTTIDLPQLTAVDSIEPADVDSQQENQCGYTRSRDRSLTDTLVPPLVILHPMYPQQQQHSISDELPGENEMYY